MSKGGGGSRPAATQTVTQETKLPPWQEAASQFGVSEARKLYDAGQPTLFPEGTVIPFAQQSEDALRSMEALARSGRGTSPAVDEFNRTVGGNYLYGNPGFNAAYQAAANQIIPQVQSQFARAGRSGSGLAQTAMAERLGDVFASLYGQERQRQVGALPMAQQMFGLQYQPAAQLAAVGSALEGQAARELAEKIQRYEYREQTPYAALDQYLSRLGGVAPFAGTVSQQTNPLFRSGGGGLGLLGGALSLGRNLFGGGLASGLGAALGGGAVASGAGSVLGALAGPAALLGSDRRIKEDIKRVGKTDSGTNIYTFRYKGNPVIQMGVMAQELAKKQPDAVHEHQGVKFVDYSRVS